MIDNSLSAYWHALSKDSPGKTWWRAKPLHDAVFKALRIDRNDEGAVYAVHPFRLHIDAETGRKAILVAYPAPRVCSPPDADWLNIEQVLVWNPVKGAVRLLGDETPGLFGSFDEGNTLHADPLRFFQEWAQRRAAFAVQVKTALVNRWHAVPTERECAPGCLIVGDVKRIHWAPHALPEHLECAGIDPMAINRAIIRAARLPRAFERAAA